MSVLPVGFGSSGVDVGDIQNSLRFRSAGICYLGRTPGIAGNRKTWTWSGWVKRGALADGTLFKVTSGAQYDFFYFLSNALSYNLNTGTNYVYTTTALFRDPSAHIHIVLSIDTTQAADADRVRIYVNGALQARTAGGIPQNTDTYANAAPSVPHHIGSNGGANTHLDGYLSRVCFVDGQALTPSSFGYLSTEINEWVSKKQSEVKAVVDAGGANSFLLDFDDATSLTTLGYDKSSKGNNWTCNNISLTAGVTYDHMTDVPGNSFATLNPLALNPSTTASTCTNGNLTATASAANTLRKCSVRIPDSGKWYGMAKVGGTVALFGLGEKNMNAFGTNSSSADARTFYLYNTASLYSILPGADTGIVGGLAAGATLAFAYDADTLKLWLGYAASGAGSITWVGGGDPAAGTSATYTLASPSELYPVVGTDGVAVDLFFGQRPTPYTPPTGFLALCQANLPDIDPTTLLDPTDHHIDITVTKSGDTNFTLPWNATDYDTFFEIKRRDAAGDWYQIDGLRGYDKILKSNSTAAETTDANVLGVSGTTCTLKSTLPNGTYVISATKAGLSASRQTNTDGTITSMVSRNVDSGFSIVLYTGTGANATVGHGLGVVPKMVVVKNRSGNWDWANYHSTLGGTKYLVLNKTDAAATNSTLWNNTDPTSTVFSISTAQSVNVNGNLHVAYCYADSAIQKSFSYTGNGSADGPNPFLGFKCGRSLFKNAGVAATWMVHDSARDTCNPSIRYISPNAADLEYANYAVDFTASGVKVRVGFIQENGSGNTIIGHAWAATTGKYALAR